MFLLKGKHYLNCTTNLPLPFTISPLQGSRLVAATEPAPPGRVAPPVDILQLHIVIQTLGLRLQVEAGEAYDHAVQLGGGDPDPVVQVVVVRRGEAGGSESALGGVHGAVQVQALAYTWGEEKGIVQYGKSFGCPLHQNLHLWSLYLQGCGRELWVWSPP